MSLTISPGMDVTVETSKGIGRRYMELSDEKLDRLTELRELYESSSDEEEKSEIANVALEILWPETPNSKSRRLGATGRGINWAAIRGVAEYRRNVGKQVQLERENQGLTQQELADRAGIPPKHVALIERGKHAATADAIARLAEFLKVPPTVLDPSWTE